MAQYRLYIMTCSSFRIEHFHDLVAADDRDAISQALEAQSSGTMELWHGARLVKRWESPVAPHEGSPIAARVPERSEA
jgi:hypothetical protein